MVCNFIDQYCVFCLNTDAILFFRLNENMNLSSVVENHLKPGPWNHQLRQFCDEQLDCLKFFIRKYPKVSFLSFAGGIVEYFIMVI